MGPFWRQVRNEAIATLGMLGAAMTIVAKLMKLMTPAPWLDRLVELWREWTTHWFGWTLSLVGLPIHSHLIVALSIALFVGMIGIGAALSRAASGQRIKGAWDERSYTWPGLLVFAALVLVFFLGDDPKEKVLLVRGSPELGRFTFAAIAASGFILGEAIGGNEFRRRLLRMAVLAAVILAANALTVMLRG